MISGRFITLEGGEGSGKTTQITLLKAAFSAAGIPVATTREPGGTPSAEEIRGLLVRGEAEKWDDIAELLLFYAARREHVVKRIKPALEAGTYVLCDRFSDSSRIYQGMAKGLGDGYIMALHRLTLGDFQPDITLWLDMDAGKGLTRAKARETSQEENRFEKLNQDFHKRVRAGFTTLAREEPERFIRIDAGQEIGTVHKNIIEELNRRFALALLAQE